MRSETEFVKPVNDEQFETQKHIMAGTWDVWGEEQRREHVRILVREAHCCPFDIDGPRMLE